MTTYEHQVLFPDEAFDTPYSDIEDSEQEVFSNIVNELRVASKQVRDAYNGIWDAEYEGTLANKIRAGLEAELAAQNEDRPNEQNAEIIMEGKQARYDLVVANLPFAAYMAKASVGIRPLPYVNGDVSAVPRSDGEYMGRLKEVGTYARIANLAHPRASLEDRLQIAMETMWDVAEKYQSRPGKGKAKFTTYAAWQIQNKLSQESMREVGGWDVDRSVYDRYITQLNESRLYNSPLPVNRHVVEGHERHIGLHQEKMLKGRKSISLDNLSKMSEEVDQFGDYIELEAMDMIPDHDSERKVVQSVEIRDFKLKLRELLSVLSVTEASVISMRFGLDDGMPKTLDEIGEVIGKTRERVRQIESKSMSKVRWANRYEGAAGLSDYLDGFSEPVTVALAINQDPDADGTSHIKTKRMKARKKLVDEEEGASQKEVQSRDPNLESWQANENDQWDDPVRHKIAR